MFCAAENCTMKLKNVDDKLAHEYIQKKKNIIFYINVIT